MSYKSEYEGFKRSRTGVAKTPEEIAARRMAAVERSRKYREQKKATETPEQAAERCAKRAEHLRKMRAIRTAEQRAKRNKQLMKTLAMVTLEKFSQETEQLEQSIGMETPIPKSDLPLQESELINSSTIEEKELTLGDQHLKDIQERQAMETSGEATESSRQHSFTQNLDSSETQDGEDNLCGLHEFYDDENTDPESSINFEEQDSKKRATIKDALHCIKLLLDASKKRDEYSIYGEYIAQKIRTSNRESFEINIAQHHIENVIFKLCMGVYSQESTPTSSFERQHMSASSCFQPLSIPKTEPDS